MDSIWDPLGAPVGSLFVPKRPPKRSKRAQRGKSAPKGLQEHPISPWKTPLAGQTVLGAPTSLQEASKASPGPLRASPGPLPGLREDPRTFKMIPKTAPRGQKPFHPSDPQVRPRTVHPSTEAWIRALNLEPEVRVEGSGSAGSAKRIHFPSPRRARRPCIQASSPVKQSWTRALHLELAVHVERSGSAGTAKRIQSAAHLRCASAF